MTQEIAIVPDISSEEASSNLYKQYYRDHEPSVHPGLLAKS